MLKEQVPQTLVKIMPSYDSSGASPPYTRSSWVSLRRVASPPHAKDPPRTTIRERTMTPNTTFIKCGLPSLCRRVYRVLPGAEGVTLPPQAPHHTCLLTSGLPLTVTPACRFALRVTKRGVRGIALRQHCSARHVDLDRVHAGDRVEDRLRVRSRNATIFSSCFHFQLAGASGAPILDLHPRCRKGKGARRAGRR